MYKSLGILGFLFVSFNTFLQAQEIIKAEDPVTKFAGYHVGVVQILFGVHKSELSALDKSDFYSIGFPMGLTFNTGCKLKIDFEIVPVVKPYLQEETPYKVHLLYHPGILVPLNKNFTFGLRLAFEAGENQFGFTPLLNKSFALGKRSIFFIELVAPIRFAKNQAFNQLIGIHLGLGL
ncbi:MAG TPA: hypothetical protein PLS73_11655 [Saprospiraceae bacterium]|nr:hypothetical protein [Saprospiraceae bacterium]